VSRVFWPKYMRRIALRMMNQNPVVIQTDLVRDLDAIGTSERVFVVMAVENRSGDP
jgi:hypothetical protein